MGACISAIKKMLKKNKKVVDNAIDKLDEYDNIVFDKIEDILEDEIKKRTNMDIELGEYIDKIDNGLTGFAKNTIYSNKSKEKKE